MTPCCSVIIPAFNHADLTKQGVEAVLRTVRPEIEIIVVDDGSTESMPGFDARIRVIRHEANSGFAAACNTGAGAARGELLVFINNDTIPHPGWLDALIDYAENHPRAAVIGSKLLDASGKIQHAGVKICQDRYPRQAYVGYPGDHPAVNKSRGMQVVSAACALVRRGAFEQAGGFDSAYRNGFEDVDLCLRLGELGHEIHYCAQSVVTHLEFFSDGRFRDAKSNADLYRQRWFQRVRPDGLPFYLQDDFLRLGYDKQYPAGLKPSAQLEYLTMRRRIVETVVEVTPPDSSIVVVSKGDRRLLEMNGRVARHFPQSETGGYAGHHLQDSAAVSAHLDEMRRQGAEYFVLPETSYWWLDYYESFRDYLTSSSRQITNGDSPCMVFELCGKSAAKLNREDDSELRQIFELAQLVIPPKSTVVVVDGDDPRLLNLDNFCTQGFGNPYDGAEAIVRIEELRQEGAQYIILPAVAFWWLDVYPDFRRYLETEGSLVAHDADACAIYSLRRLKWIRPAAPAKVIAILAVRNEEKCIAACLEHYAGQGVEVYLIDNGSTDQTVAVAESYRGRGLAHIDHLPFTGVFSQSQIDRRKEEIAATLDADWLIYTDADEFRVPPRSDWTLAEAFAAVDAAGYNAVNFWELVFLPTRESPDHDHPGFHETMRSYYFFLQHCPFRITAWKRQPGRVQLNPHRISFPGLRLCPEFFVMKHYQFLSAKHAAQKYGSRRHATSELRAGDHGGAKGWREQYSGWSFPLPEARDLKTDRGGDDWDLSAPWSQHYLERVLEGELIPERLP